MKENPQRRKIINLSKKYSTWKKKLETMKERKKYRKKKFNNWKKKSLAKEIGSLNWRNNLKEN